MLTSHFFVSSKLAIVQSRNQQSPLSQKWKKMSVEYQYTILILQNTSYCLEKQIRRLDCRIQYVVRGRRFDTSYPTGGYGVSVSKKTRYAVSGKVDMAYWAAFLGVRDTFKSISDIIPNLLDLLYPRIVIFMDTAYVDSMDTPYWELVKRMNENKGKIQTKVELTMEQSQQGVSDDVLFAKEAMVSKTMESLKEIKLNPPLLKENRKIAILQNQLPQKEKDLGSFVLPCSIGDLTVRNALADLGASISIMSFSMYKRLGLGKLEPVNMIVEMVDRTKSVPIKESCKLWLFCDPYKEECDGGDLNDMSRKNDDKNLSTCVNNDERMEVSWERMRFKNWLRVSHDSIKEEDLNEYLDPENFGDEKKEIIQELIEDCLDDDWCDTRDLGRLGIIQEEVVIVCHEKVVKISLEGDEILRVPAEALRYEMKRQAEMLRDIDQQMERGQMMVSTLWIILYSEYEYEIRYHPGKANVVTAQSEAFKQENVFAEGLHGLDQQMERKEDESFLRYLSENGIELPWILSLNCQDKIKEWNSGDDQLRLRWMIYLVVLADAAESALEDIIRACVIDFGSSYHSSIRCAPFETSYGRKCRSHFLWAEIRESNSIRPEIIQEITDKVVSIKEKFKAVSPWKGVICFRKKGKLAPRYVDPFDILERIGTIAYRLRLPEELSSIEADKTLRFVKELKGIMDREI
ncbi:putative reverse transcriptase domain-containing protein [Tanacetum coccineum]